MCGRWKDFRNASFNMLKYNIIFGSIRFDIQSSIYWGGGGGRGEVLLKSLPKSFTEKKFTAISNKDLF